MVVPTGGSTTTYCWQKPDRRKPNFARHWAENPELAWQDQEYLFLGKENKPVEAIMAAIETAVQIRPSPFFLNRNHIPDVRKMVATLDKQLSPLRIKKMNNLTTKFGDGGWTKNVNGSTISKGSKDILAMAYGDWLNVQIGKVHASFPMLLTSEQNTQLQKAYSTLMAQISARSAEVYPLDPEYLKTVDQLSAEIREELLDFRMNDWLIYEGNDAQICSKLSRVFESMYVEAMGNQLTPSSSETVLEYQFINRVSDMFFYMGLLIQISKPCLSSQ